MFVFFQAGKNIMRTVFHKMVSYCITVCKLFGSYNVKRCNLMKSVILVKTGGVPLLAVETDGKIS